MSRADETQISALITSRANALGITRKALVMRLGFRNIPKGLRRLNEVFDGDFTRSQLMLERLPDALAVDPNVVQAALRATLDAKLREEYRRYRENFRPHAIIQTERTRPEPLFVALLIGVEKILRIDFEDNSPPVTYAVQSRAAVQRRSAKNGILPAFGRPVSFVVNYSPDKAVVFALNGSPQNVLRNAVRYNEGHLKLEGRSPIGAHHLQDFIIF